MHIEHPTSYLALSGIANPGTSGQKLALFLLFRVHYHRICPDIGIILRVLIVVAYALDCAGKALQGYPFESTCADDK